MSDKKAVFIYPIPNDPYKFGGNTYIHDLIAHLSPTFTIVNKKTSLGLLDMLLKLPKCDVLYFNWIEDVVDRPFGFVQVALLTVILFLAKLFNIKLVWFIHNNLSHYRKHEGLKKFIVRRLRTNADLILAHSNEVALEIPRNKFYVFDHPIDAYQPLPSTGAYAYDLLIWGTVSPYKGITEFVKYVAVAPGFKDKHILIAGKFASEAYYNEVKNSKPTNVLIENKVVPEEELVQRFAESRYILFTYNSPSVLSSAALCKSLSFGKEVIGPDIGAFKELGRKELLYTYASFPELEKLLNELQNGNIKPIDKTLLASYIERVSWPNFARFITDTINGLFKKQYSQ